MKLNIRILYLYLFSFIGLLIAVIGSVRLIQLGLNVYVFKGADMYEYSKPYPIQEGNIIVSTEEAKLRDKEDQEIRVREVTRQRQREAAGGIAMIVVGIPLYLYHWKTIQKSAEA
jgi:hypothetical protein